MKPTLRDGLAAPFRALNFLLSHIGLVKYFLIPLCINIVIFGLGTWVFIHYFGDILHWLVSPPAAWYQYILYYCAAVILGLLFSVVLVFGFTAVGNLIASPFNDVLSERTEELWLGEKLDQPFRLSLIVKDAGAAVTNELKKIGLLIVVQIGLLLCNFIPVVGSIIYAVGSPLAVIFFLAFEYLDFTMSRKRMPFGEKWKLIMDHKSAGAGMGMIFFFTTVVPFVNFFVMPFAVIGATLLYLQIKYGPAAPVPDDGDEAVPEVDQVINDVLSNS